MGKNYEDWNDIQFCEDHGHCICGNDCMNPCPHAEVDTQGVCEDCGIEVPGWEPDDAQLLTQFGTKEPVA